MSGTGERINYEMRNRALIVAINYANLKYKKAQYFNSNTAIHKGKADRVISYSPKDIDAAFWNQNSKILKQKRGNGYWLWKPYFIQETLKKLCDGDYLVYLDSGAFYLNDVRHLIRQMDKDKQDIMAFELPFQECRFTKRDVFIEMGCDEPEYFETNQRMATMIILKRSDRAVKFVKEWLDYCQCEHIITDEKNNAGKNNYKGFIDNRHDQSIFSLLSKKYGIKAYRDPSQYGRFPDVFWDMETRDAEDHSKYPQIIAEHRQSEVTRHIFWEQMMFAYAPKILIKTYLQHVLLYRSVQEKRVAVLTDNMPVRDEMYGHGMYKVVNRLLQSLGDRVYCIIITDRFYNSKNLEVPFQNKSVIINKFHSICPDVLSNAAFLYEIRKSMRELKQKKIKKLFIPLGADYRELERAYWIAEIYHMSVGIYVVDDFIEYQKKIIGRESPETEKKIIRYLKRINRIFVVSDGMKDRIYRLTGRKSVVLPIPYENQFINEPVSYRKLQIMFLGSINQLYLEGLRDIAETIDKINRERKLDIKLRFTYKSAAEVKHIVGNYDCISSQRIDGEKELMKELREGLFCFMPFSDRADFTVMQNTSFPSKLIEYLAAASSIVIYGNQKNSAQRYFEKNNLFYVIYGRDRKLLEECIIKHLEQEQDHSVGYRRILERSHSFDKTSRKISWYL